MSALGERLPSGARSHVEKWGSPEAWAVLKGRVSSRDLKKKGHMDMVRLFIGEESLRQFVGSLWLRGDAPDQSPPASGPARSHCILCFSPSLEGKWVFQKQQEIKMSERQAAESPTASFIQTRLSQVCLKRPEFRVRPRV